MLDSMLGSMSAAMMGVTSRPMLSFLLDSILASMLTGMFASLFGFHDGGHVWSCMSLHVYVFVGFDLSPLDFIHAGLHIRYVCGF